MKIATWNVNSIRARLEHLDKWIKINEPDVLCLQETKVTDDLFPHEEFKEAGYLCHVSGQKSYNGVAILTRLPASDIATGLTHLPDDDPLNSQCRLIAATIAGVRIICAYMPNGEEVGSEKFDFKLSYFNELRTMLDKNHDPGELLMVCGDFNIAPESIDLYNPEDREGCILFSRQEHEALANVRDFGLLDLFRRHHKEPERYSWWDYRAGMFWKKLGIRLDHMWVTQALAARAGACDIDERPRRWKRPSDHTIVWAEIDI